MYFSGRFFLFKDMIRVYEGAEIYLDIIIKLYAEHGIAIDKDDAMFDVLITAEPISTYEANVFAIHGKVKTIKNISVPIRCVYDYVINKLCDTHSKYNTISYLLMNRAIQLQQKKTISIFTIFHNRFKEEVDMDILEFVQDPLGAGRKYASLFIGVNITKFNNF